MRQTNYVAAMYQRFEYNLLKIIPFLLLQVLMMR